MPAENAAEHRLATVLIVDIAGTVALRTQIGDETAERRIRALLDFIIETARAHGGQFIKSYGDDVLAAFEGRQISAAAEVAMLAQREAARAGLQLYAGLHSGMVEFRTTMGHPDAVGLTVSIAARLHKLTEGMPGRVFLLVESVAELTPELRARASLYGAREMKGLGLAVVWTLDWQEQPTTPWTLLTTDVVTDRPTLPLLLRHGDTALHLPCGSPPVTMGRYKDCTLRLIDVGLRVSSTHLTIEYDDARWFVRDSSRNGTWLRESPAGIVSTLPQSGRVPLPPSGELCLGHSFDDDPQGQFTVRFELQNSSDDSETQSP